MSFDTNKQCMSTQHISNLDTCILLRREDSCLIIRMTESARGLSVEHSSKGYFLKRMDLFEKF